MGLWDCSSDGQCVFYTKYEYAVPCKGAYWDSLGAKVCQLQIRVIRNPWTMSRHGRTQPTTTVTQPTGGGPQTATILYEQCQRSNLLF